MSVEFSIIGAGRLGTCLGRALVEKGYLLKGLTCLSVKSASESRTIIGQGEIYSQNYSAASQGKIVFLTVPDDSLKKVVHELVSSNINWKGRIIFHCSGLISSRILLPLQKKGALTASLHPVQTFHTKNMETKVFHNIYFGFEGNRLALGAAKEIMKVLQGNLFFISPSKKSTYHAACSLASNHFIALLYIASNLLKDSGVDENKSLKILFPLVESTLKNMKKNTLAKAITGPISRGDKETVASHVKALYSQPETIQLYRILSKKILHLLKEADRLDPSTIKSLKDLLEEN